MPDCKAVSSFSFGCKAGGAADSILDTEPDETPSFAAGKSFEDSKAGVVVVVVELGRLGLDTADSGVGADPVGFVADTTLAV